MVSGVEGSAFGQLGDLDTVKANTVPCFSDLFVLDFFFFSTEFLRISCVKSKMFVESFVDRE